MSDWLARATNTQNEHQSAAPPRGGSLSAKLAALHLSAPLSSKLAALRLSAPLSSKLADPQRSVSLAGHKSKDADDLDLDWVMESEIAAPLSSKLAAPLRLASLSSKLAALQLSLSSKVAAPQRSVSLAGDLDLGWVTESEIAAPLSQPLSVAQVRSTLAQTLASVHPDEHEHFHRVLAENATAYSQIIAAGDSEQLAGFFGSIRKAGRQLFTSKKDKAKKAAKKEKAAAAREMQDSSAATASSQSTWFAERHGVPLEGRTVKNIFSDIGRKFKRAFVGTGAPQLMSVYTGAAVGAKSALLALLADAKSPALLSDLPAASSPFQAAGRKTTTDKLLLYAYRQSQIDLVPHKDVPAHTLVPRPDGPLAALSSYVVTEYDLRRVGSGLTLGVLLDRTSEMGRVRGQKLGLVFAHSKLEAEVLPQVELTADEAEKPAGLLSHSIWFTSGDEKARVPPLIFRFEAGAAGISPLQRRLVAVLAITSADGSRKRVLLNEAAHTLNSLLVGAVDGGAASLAAHEQALVELAASATSADLTTQRAYLRASELLATTLAAHVMPQRALGHVDMPATARIALDEKHVCTAREAARPLTPLARRYLDAFAALGTCCDSATKTELRAHAACLGSTVLDAAQTHRHLSASVLSQMTHAAFAHCLGYSDGADRIASVWQGTDAATAFDSY